MPKAFTLGNGSFMVGLDKFGQVHDLYFPYIGLENHAGGNLVHKIGVYVDGVLSWIDDGSWHIETSCPHETMASMITARNDEHNILLTCEDVVYNEKNIFIRSITIKNTAASKREIKLYINQQFEIYESHRGDTAYYDPINRAIVHYKGRRVFLMNADYDKLGIDDYSIGLHGIEGKEGTHKDAEDGRLSLNPIEHGSVDSTVGFTFDIKGGDQSVLYYWLCAAETVHDARALNTYVLGKTAKYLIETTQNYWRAWVNKQDIQFGNLDENIKTLFKQSLLIIRAHTDASGSIIASGDSDLLKQGRDYYNYMWPRDAACTVLALDKAGYSHVSRAAFAFCEKIITDQGYMMHKYRPDGSLGASWEPWVRNGQKQLPIQEDETALVIYALWEYYAHAKDLEFIESIYNSLIKKAAEFMVSYIDPETGLPLPSYDLWEEKYGTCTFTSAAVYGGLLAASQFAGLLGKSQNELKYKTFAEKIKKAMIDHLYDEQTGYFCKLVVKEGGTYVKDMTLDMSSVYALYQFGILSIDDPRLVRMIAMVHERLECRTDIGGVARYENDYYFLVSHDVPGNPWIITTLWLAQYYIRAATAPGDLDKPRAYLQWAVDRSQRSGILSEQMNPFTGEQLSASPLTWSHAEFVTTVLMYIDAQKRLSQ